MRLTAIFALATLPRFRRARRLRAARAIELFALAFGPRRTRLGASRSLIAALAFPTVLKAVGLFHGARAAWARAHFARTFRAVPSIIEAAPVLFGRAWTIAVARPRPLLPPNERPFLASELRLSLIPKTRTFSSESRTALVVEMWTGSRTGETGRSFWVVESWSGLELAVEPPDFRTSAHFTGAKLGSEALHGRSPSLLQAAKPSRPLPLRAKRTASKRRRPEALRSAWRGAKTKLLRTARPVRAEARSLRRTASKPRPAEAGLTGLAASRAEIVAASVLELIAARAAWAGRTELAPALWSVARAIKVVAPFHARAIVGSAVWAAICVGVPISHGRARRSGRGLRSFMFLGAEGPS